MFLFIIAVVLTLIALGAILVGVSGKSTGSVIGGIAGLLVSAVLIAFATVTIVPTKTVGIPVTFSRTPGSIRSLAPELGEHGDEIRAELQQTSPRHQEKS